MTSECSVKRVICKTWTGTLANSAGPVQTPQNLFPMLQIIFIVFDRDCDFTEMRINEIIKDRQPMEEVTIKRMEVCCTTLGELYPKFLQKHSKFYRSKKIKFSMSYTFYVARHTIHPAGTWRLYNVGSKSMQRHDVASTLRRRCINVMCLLGKLYWVYSIMKSANP